jgi:hypothetical protein
LLYSIDLREDTMNRRSIAALFMVMIVISWVHEVEPETLPPPEGSAWLATVIDSPNPDLIGESHYHGFHNGRVYVSGEWYVLRDSFYLDVYGTGFFLIVRNPDSLEFGKVVTGLLLPMGIGIASDEVNTFLLTRISSSWTPPKQ